MYLKLGTKYATDLILKHYKSCLKYLLIYKVAKRGEVLKVKVLGTVALIDEGKYYNLCYIFKQLFCIHIQWFIIEII